MQTPPVARRIALTVATGGVAFLLTNVTDQPLFPALVLSLLVGGITLLGQFLFDLDRRQADLVAELAALREQSATTDERVRAGLRDEVAKIGDATLLHQRLEQASSQLGVVSRLVERLTATSGVAPGLGMRVAYAELAAATDLLDVVSRDGEAASDGEDRDWLIALTELCVRSIDAVSHGSQGPDESFSDDGFWDTELGGRYLELQREATRRGVRVRRMFVVPNAQAAAHPDFRVLLASHVDAGVVVRVLVISSLSPSWRRHIPDIVLFDDEVSYELSLAPRVASSRLREFVMTRLSVQPTRVRDRARQFADLWDLAADIGDEPIG
jgi:hypothetical protein